MPIFDCIGLSLCNFAKYEFYIDDILAETVTTTERIATYNVIGKTAATTYACKVKVYDVNGNSTYSNVVDVTTRLNNLVVNTVNNGQNQTYDGLTMGDFILVDMKVELEEEIQQQLLQPKQV